MFTGTIILGLFVLLIVAIAYGYPVRKLHDPMADTHGDVPHVGPWVKRRPF